MADALQENRYPCIGPSKPKGGGKLSGIKQHKEKNRQTGQDAVTDEGSTCSYLEKQYGPTPSGRFSLVIVF